MLSRLTASSERTPGMSARNVRKLGPGCRRMFQGRSRATCVNGGGLAGADSRLPRRARAGLGARWRGIGVPHSGQLPVSGSPAIG